MDKRQAQDIIRNTFESSFDIDSFTGFIKNLLNRIDDAPFTYQGNYIPDAYKQYIKKLQRIGKFTDGQNNIDILVITLQKETSLERARTIQRNFIAWYLNGSRGNVMKDAALAAFVSPDEADWRFSLVKMDYKFEQTKTGKMKVKEEFTPARRWSFLVGANEGSHTAQSRLVGILANDEQAPNLKELENAFDIETVTKEFFLKYRQLFLRTKEELDKVIENDPKIKADFESNGVDTVNFAKKLLGQIVFLYFLQKKGWFGVGRDNDWGAGSKHFLRELFAKNHGDYNNFFNDILEPLFYEALRIDRSHDDGYYSQFDCKIPFLNGGLFDPIGNYDWVHTDILLPDSLFSNKVKTKEGDEGDGILNIFDRYNFTVKEDEPLEKEVAIDPELLGKAYEKFNAIRPDNFEEYKKALKSGKKGEESKFNRQFGVYYTPREIVHYMCQQSLINSLYSELNRGPVSYEKLGDSQLDMFGNKGKKGQLDLTIEHKSTPSISKEDIETLIHIGEHVSENEAVALLKEKLISEGKQKTTKNKPILPESIRTNAKQIDEILANITVCDPAVGSGAFPVGMMNEIVRARNVLSVFINNKCRTAYDFKRRCIEYSLYGVDIDPGAVEIAKLRLWLSLVVDEDDIKNIKPLPNLDYKVVCGNSLLGVEKNLLNKHLFVELEKLKQPYFNETNIKKKQEYKKQIDDLISQITNGHTEFDFEVYFSEVFHNKGGFDVVIANPPYDVYQGDKKNEIQVIRKMSIYNIAGGGKLNAYKLFLAKSARLQKPNGVICEIFQNSFLADRSAKKLRKYFLGNQSVIQLDSFPERDNDKLRVFEDVKMSVCIMLCLNNSQNNYNFNLKIWKDKFMSSSRNILLNNIETLEYDKENATIPSISQKEVSVLKKVSAYDRLSTYAKCYEGEINLTFHKHYLENKPDGHAKMIKGAAVQKWLIKDRMSQGEIKHLDSNSYLKENTGKKSQHHKLRRIVMQGITGVDEKIRLKMTIIAPGIFCGNSVNYILIDDKNVDYECLLAILNSHLMNWYFKVFSTNSNVNGYEVDNFPIPNISKVNQKNLSNLVDQVLTSKRAKPARDISALEREINRLVYKLYGLTKEEIAIVETSGS